MNKWKLVNDKIVKYTILTILKNPSQNDCLYSLLLFFNKPFLGFDSSSGYSIVLFVESSQIFFFNAFSTNGLGFKPLSSNARINSFLWLKTSEADSSFISSDFFLGLSLIMIFLDLLSDLPLFFIVYW